MASTFELKSKHYDGRQLILTCTQHQNVSENKSIIYWRLTSSGGGSNYYSTGPTTVVIDGTLVYYKGRVNWDSKAFPAATGSVTGQLTVKHNTESGKRSIDVSLTTAIYESTQNTVSDTWTLDAIPRQAAVLGFTWENDEANPTIIFQNYAESSVTKLQLDLMPLNTSEVLASRVITNYASWVNYTLELTDAERRKVWNCYNENKTTITDFKVRLATTLGETVLYSTCNLLKVPMINSAPLVNLNLTMDDSTKSIAGTTPILDYTHLTYRVEATPQKGATIASYYYKNPPYESRTQTGTNLFQTTYFDYGATDIRGTETRHTGVINAIEYKALTCRQKVHIELEGEAQAKVSVDITGNYYRGMIETKETPQPNTLDLFFRYCEDTEDIEQVEWVHIGTYQSYEDGEYKTVYNIPELLDYKKGYKFQCYAQDFLLIKTTAVYATRITPVFDWSEIDFNFNVPVTIQGVNILEKLEAIERRLAAEKG